MRERSAEDEIGEAFRQEPGKNQKQKTPRGWEAGTGRRRGSVDKPGESPEGEGPIWIPTGPPSRKRERGWELRKKKKISKRKRRGSRKSPIRVTRWSERCAKKPSGTPKKLHPKKKKPPQKKNAGRGKKANKEDHRFVSEGGLPPKRPRDRKKELGKSKEGLVIWKKENTLSRQDSSRE